MLIHIFFIFDIGVSNKKYGKFSNLYLCDISMNIKSQDDFQRVIYEDQDDPSIHMITNKNSL